MDIIQILSGAVLKNGVQNKISKSNTIKQNIYKTLQFGIDFMALYYVVLKILINGLAGRHL